MNRLLYVQLVVSMMILAGCGTQVDNPQIEHLTEDNPIEMAPSTNQWEMDGNRRIQDKELGITLAWDAKKTWWTGELVIDNISVSVLINPGSDEESPQRYMEILRSVADALATSGDSYTAYIADHFLENYNDNWRDDGAPLDRSEFIQRLTLESFVIDSDGDVSVYYNADGMFTDHGIEVSLDNALQPRSSTLA